MREWVYTYKTSDGFRHEGEMRSDSKDGVYAELRKQGIHAIKVWERITPVVRSGFRGLRKRDWLLICGVVLALLVVIPLMLAKRAQDQVRESLRTAQATEQVPRCQLPIDDMDEAAGVAFSRKSERWLARFAQPGKIVGTPLNDLEKKAVLEDLTEAFDEDIVVLDADSDEIAELKRVVAGMKQEVRLMIQNGRTPESVFQYFEDRQRMEAEYAERIRNGSGSLQEKGARLRAMGLPELADKGEK